MIGIRRTDTLVRGVNERRALNHMQVLGLEVGVECLAVLAIAIAQQAVVVVQGKPSEQLVVFQPGQPHQQVRPVRQRCLARGPAEAVGFVA